MKRNIENGPMLNAYPDSLGGNLKTTVQFLQQPGVSEAFSSFYILPSMFHSDLDRGFSVIDYGLNEKLVTKEDLIELEKMQIDLKLDFILNHASVLSNQFQDLLRYGENSKYKDFFINWNQFWEGHGTMTEEGYIQPEKEMLNKMFFRKPGFPILMVRMPDGTQVPYWNTFYQEIQYPQLDAEDIMKAVNVQQEQASLIAQIMNQGIQEGKSPKEIKLGEYCDKQSVIIELYESHRKYLGQMDLNIKSPLVWEFYEDTISKLAAYGAKIVRLDAFAYAPKEPGEKNFLNEPGTWELLEQINQIASKYDLELLPEIHASYEEKIYEVISQKGYMTYDFFLPGLVLDALEHEDGSILKAWAQEIYKKKIRTVNMLGCHDGIPLLDLKGLIDESRIQTLIDTVVARGGYVKNLHGQKNLYYQVNATYYSALGESDAKMLLARALQLFMPGKPQVWYLDVLAGKNDHEAVARAGVGGHKEINRTNIDKNQLEELLQNDIVQHQLSMLRFRNEFPVFSLDADFQINSENEQMEFIWRKNGYQASLKANLANAQFQMYGINPDGKTVFQIEQW